MEPTESARLNNELLKEDEAPSDEKPSPKRNSKEELTAKILKVVDVYALDFTYSDTKLKRMNKVELQKLLASVVEEGVKHDLAKSVGADPRLGDQGITLGALRMVHNLCATGFEKVWNSYGAKYTGYECEGFSETLRDPSVQTSVDDCLREIAKQNPEILEYFDSPYTRLALVWSGCLITCIKKKDHRIKENYAERMGPHSRVQPDSPRLGRRGGQTVREVDSYFPPVLPSVRKV